MSCSGIPSRNGLCVCFLAFGDATAALLELLVGRASAQSCFELKPSAERMLLADGVSVRATERFGGSESSSLVNEIGRRFSLVAFVVTAVSALSPGACEGGS